MERWTVLVSISVCCFLSNAEIERKSIQKPYALTQEKLRKVSRLSDMNQFRTLLNPLLTERVSGTEGNRLVQEHIKHYMGGEYKWNIEEDSFEDDTPLQRVVFTNIIATLNPNASYKFVLACHFDSKYFKNIRFIGATDSAVPCAMLLDLARTFNSTLHRWKDTHPDAQKVGLQFIFFDGEEAVVDWTSTDSLYGARHLAEKMSHEPVKDSIENELGSKLDTMVAMVLLDLIGAKEPHFHNWFRETEHLFERLSKLEEKLGKLGELHPYSYRYFVKSAALGGGIQDDHIPFQRKGNVPVLHLISYPFPPFWHKTEDDLSALDFNTIENLNAILRAFVAEFLHLSP